MPRVSVNPKILDWAIRRSGPTSLLDQKFPKLDDWLTGKIQPTIHQLESFARATSTPFGYLFLDSPPNDILPIPHFRTIRDQAISKPSPNLLETVHTMERRQEWMRNYLLEQGFEPLAFVAKLAPVIPQNFDAIEAAREIKHSLHLENHWTLKCSSWINALNSLRLKAEDSGIIVAINGIVGNNTHRKLDPSEFRGFVLVDEYAPLVFINGADSKAAQMFTLAHEIAHIWLGVSAVFDLNGLQPADDKIEKICNEIAAEFLVPEAELKSIWPQIKQDTAPFESLAKLFKVSQLVAARRASDLGLIPPKVYSNFYKQYLAKEFSHSLAGDQSGGDFYRTQNQRLSRRFAETVITATRGGKLLYNEAYRLTGLYGETFEHYADTLGRRE